MIDTRMTGRSAGPKADGPRMRVCVVAEDDVVRGMIDDFLTDRGHVVVPIKYLSDLPDTLARDTGAIDVIIAPLPGGSEWARKLVHGVHRTHPEIRFVAMTAQGSVISAQQAVSCGVHAYLHTPVRLAELELVLIRLAQTDKASPALG